ncbi:MAG: hypothetical protein LBI02_10650 [Opitutaceae bacterium]|jgi:hypothetical protein|nr:hypothetical protein [Opitutaceae bacterium]
MPAASPPPQTNARQKAPQLLTDTFRWQKAAYALAEEHTGNKNEAFWNPPSGLTNYVRPNTTPTGLDTLHQSDCGAISLAVALCNEILLNKTGRLDDAIRELLCLNPLSKKTPPTATGENPSYTAFIEKNQRAVRFAKGDYHYFLVRVDHGTGAFDHEYPALESPWRDAPLPEAAPKMWRVQLLGYAKGATAGIPSDIIDVAAKAYQTEHSEGAS